VIVESWRAKREVALDRYTRLLTELRASGGASLSMLLVVVREMAVLERA
jgi:glutamate dehydrogenase